MPKPTNHDEYIDAAADFAVPILQKIRKAMHKACPGVEETMRWGTPHFDHEGVLANVAAFKAHASFGFWRGTEMSDPEGLLEIIGKTGIGAMRLESAKDLPPERVLVRYIKEAVALNEAGGGRKKATKKKSAKKAAKKKSARSVAVPSELTKALRKNKKALATFEGFSYTNRKEYAEWIAEAKRDATREKRIETAVEWMAEGKPRNWKYMKEWN